MVTGLQKQHKPSPSNLSQERVEGVDVHKYRCEKCGKPVNVIRLEKGSWLCDKCFFK